jgi:porin
MFGLAFKFRKNTDKLWVAVVMSAFIIADKASAEGVSVSAEYKLDVSGAVSGGESPAGRALDNLILQLDGAWASAPGLSVRGSVLSNSGGRPNDVAGTLQGVDNIEVSRSRVKLYELWAQYDAGPVSMRAGLYDLNSEFYTTDSAGLLINPAFGIGSELAATGPNGPSIFPSTSLAARVRWASDRAYFQAAAINAKAGVLGDPGGMDLEFGDGALLVAEGGSLARGKVAVGAWRYTDRQPRWSPDLPPGDEATAQGAYLLVDQPLAGEEGATRTVRGFVRLGVSDGETTPFSGGAQAGLLMTQVFASRPASALSGGINTGRLSSRYRQELRGQGLAPAQAETGVELTYADQVTDHLSLQPSLQWIFNPGGDAHADGVVILTLRATLAL